MSNSALLASTDRWLARRSSAWINSLSVLLVAGIGAIDLASGYEVALSVFYVLPVAIATWYGGWRMGLWLSLLAALTWMLVDKASGHVYSISLALYWNTCVRLAFFLIIAWLLYQLRKAMALQRALAELDSLTGLLNARAFRQRVQPHFDLAARHRKSMAIAYLDLDGFKAINDKLGHGEGDQVLQAVAATLAGRLRQSDMACRMGGDEFVIALPLTGMDGARSFFAALHQNLLDMAEARHWPVGFSMGVAVVHGPAMDYARAIGCADDLMYRVKQSGKNRLLFEQFAHDDAPGTSAGRR